jgi:hypothetical protein
VEILEQQQLLQGPREEAMEEDPVVAVSGPSIACRVKLLLSQTMINIACVSNIQYIAVCVLYNVKRLNKFRRMKKRHQHS